MSEQQDKPGRRIGRRVSEARSEAIEQANTAMTGIGFQVGMAFICFLIGAAFIYFGFFA